MISLESAYAYCREDIEKIENYEKAVSDESVVWHLHHRLEISPTGELHSMKWLKENRLYYNRPASELIFLLPSEHISLHMKNRDEEIRKRQSDKMKGRPSPFRGKHFTDEQKELISRKVKEGMTEEVRQHLSEMKKGKPSPKKGIPLSEEQKEKMKHARTKEVLCVETETVYYSAHEASRQTGINRGNICACCRGKVPKAGGFHWKYVA